MTTKQFLVSGTAQATAWPIDSDGGSIGGEDVTGELSLSFHTAPQFGEEDQCRFPPE